MNLRHSTCYDQAALQQFLRAGAWDPDASWGTGNQHQWSDGAYGGASSLDEALLGEHLAECESCRRKLEELSGSQPLCAELPEMLAQEADEDTAETWDAGSALPVHDVESVRRLLGPTDDPRSLGRLGPFEVRGIIGRGSTGIVVQALDVRLNRLVAIKMLAPVYSDNGSARRRFEREGRSIASVKDDHVVPVYTVDEYRGLPYIVMQYVPDGSLWQRIQRLGALRPQEVVCVAMQIARGLAAAHDRGIIHRDVKPANVLLESGVERAMVTDFGLARVVDETTMTRSGAISGTPQYMSPEQARGAAMDQRSDLFSLGSVMYAACTGRPPFRAETVFGVIKQVVDAEAPPIREINPEVPEWLAALIAKLHQKDPENRFQSAREVADLLEQELAHLQSPTLMPQPLRPWMPPASGPVRRLCEMWRRRKRTLTPLVGTLVLGALLWTTWHLGAWSAQQGGDSGNAWAAVGHNWGASGVPVCRSTPAAPWRPGSLTLTSKTLPGPAGQVLNVIEDRGLQTRVNLSGKRFTRTTCAEAGPSSVDATNFVIINGVARPSSPGLGEDVPGHFISEDDVVLADHDGEWLAITQKAPEIPSTPQLELELSTVPRPAEQWQQRQRVMLMARADLARQLAELAREPQAQKCSREVEQQLEQIELQIRQIGEAAEKEWTRWSPAPAPADCRETSPLEATCDESTTTETPSTGPERTIIRQIQPPATSADLFGCDHRAGADDISARHRG